MNNFLVKWQKIVVKNISPPVGLILQAYRQVFCLFLQNENLKSIHIKLNVLIFIIPANTK